MVLSISVDDKQIFLLSLLIVRENVDLKGSSCCDV